MSLNLKHNFFDIDVVSDNDAILIRNIEILKFKSIEKFKPIPTVTRAYVEM